MNRREAITLMVGATAVATLPGSGNRPELQSWPISIPAGVSLPAGRHQVSMVAKLSKRRFKDVMVGPHLVFDADPYDYCLNLPGYSCLEAWVTGPVFVKELLVTEGGTLEILTDRGRVRGETVFLTEAPM